MSGPNAGPGCQHVGLHLCGHTSSLYVFPGSEVADVSCTPTVCQAHCQAFCQHFLQLVFLPNLRSSEPSLSGG